MRIVAISDTHNKFNIPLPEGDVLVHAGDLTGRGTEQEMETALNWLGSLPHEHKIVIAGNHDFIAERYPETMRNLCQENHITYLENEEVIIDGVKFWGSPWTPWFHDWAFNAGVTITEAAHRRRPFIGDVWKNIPEDTNVLITHGPPYDVLDELCFVDGTPKGQFVGCPELRKKIDEIKPDVHIFGHIHCGHGEKHINGTSFYNVAMLDEMYCLSYSPTIIDFSL